MKTTDTSAQQPEHNGKGLTASSRWNLRFMRRINWFSIILFVVAILVKLVYEVWFA